MRFLSEDGKVFNTEKECCEYEAEQRLQQEKLDRERYEEKRRREAEAERKRQEEEERRRRKNAERQARLEEVEKAKEEYIKACKEYSRLQADFTRDYGFDSEIVNFFSQLFGEGLL